MVKKTSQKSKIGGINFLISMHGQENYSWQGYIQWLDTGEKLHFRSELELMMLIHNALKSNSIDEEDIRRWDEKRKY